MLLLIDNYDSFTHNLARYFTELGQQVQVVRNDHIDCQQIQQLAPDYLVISPGPKTPDDAGVSLKAIETFAGKIPILGVCLGHQAIGQIFGASVIRAAQIKHGKTSQVFHNGTPLFNGISNPFEATRYHSLILENASLPAELNVLAWTEEFHHPEIMAIGHESLPVWGVQYHPESLLTPSGHQLLQNFLNLGKNVPLS